MTRVYGTVAARALAAVAWAFAHVTYGILLLLYRVDRRVLIGSIVAAIALTIGLIWAA